MSRSIVITSGKGGSGKSTLARALAVHLSGRDSVALIDMDMGMRSLDLMLSVQDRVVYDLADVADGVCSLKQAMVKVKDGLQLLSAAQLRGSDAISPQRMDAIIRKLKDRFDWVLIDCPAGVGRGFRNAVAGADSAILVMTQDAVSLRDAERVAGLLKTGGLTDCRLVLNRAKPNRAKGAEGPREIADALKLPLLGWIPEDPDIERGDSGPAGAAVRRIAARLRGESVPIPALKRRGYVRRVLRAIAGR